MRDNSAVVDGGRESEREVADVDIDVGAVGGGPLSALVRQRVRSLVVVDADVCGDPLDDDGDGEVANELLDHSREGGVMAGLPA